MVPRINPAPVRMMAQGNMDYERMYEQMLNRTRYPLTDTDIDGMLSDSRRRLAQLMHEAGYYG